MIKLILGIVKRTKKDADERKIVGEVCSVTGIFLNIVLFAIKALAGWLSGSIAILADSINNLSDAGSSVVSLLGFKLAGKKPDEDHPFGHGRYEYISGFIVAVLIVLMGFEIGKSSVSKIIHPEEIEGGILTIVILVVSILVKLYMALYNRNYGKKIKSLSMAATAVDSRNDSIATTMVLVSVLISKFFGLNVDGYCGLIVAGMILFSGFNTAKDMIDPLLGNPPEKEFVDEVERIVLSHKNIIGIHDLIVHDYGPGRVMLSLHAEVPGDGDIFVLHDEIDVTEKELRDKLHCHAVIHMDPIDNSSKEVTKMKTTLDSIVKSIDERITTHDVRMVAGPTHTNIIFDIVLPYDMSSSETEIKKTIATKLNEFNRDYYAVIDVDYSYVK